MVTPLNRAALGEVGGLRRTETLLTRRKLGLGLVAVARGGC